jgi:hypothetical protein
VAEDPGESGIGESEILRARKTGLRKSRNPESKSKTHGQTERVNQILEDMLRMHVMHQPRKWEDYLPLVEFAYNNGYQASLNMSPFEVLYGRQCNTPVS